MTQPEHFQPPTTNLAPPAEIASLDGVYQGDALEILGHIPDNTVDAVITDPPYGLDRDGGMLGQVNVNYSVKETHARGYADNDPDAYLAWSRLWASECERVLKPGGHLVSFAGTRTVDLLGCAVRSAGFEIREQMTWVRGGGASRGKKVKLANDRVLSSTICPGHEPIVCARTALDGTLEENYARWGTGFVNVDTSDRWVGSRGPWPRTAFEYPKPTGAERITTGSAKHPTVKPLALMRELVRLFTPPTGLVLDPFAGSGTTIEAAILEGRRYLAIEREARYLSLIDGRVARTGQVHGSDAG